MPVHDAGAAERYDAGKTQITFTYRINNALDLVYSTRSHALACSV